VEQTPPVEHVDRWVPVPAVPSLRLVGCTTAKSRSWRGVQRGLKLPLEYEIIYFELDSRPWTLCASVAYLDNSVSRRAIMLTTAGHSVLDTMAITNPNGPMILCFALEMLSAAVLTLANIRCFTRKMILSWRWFSRTSEWTPASYSWSEYDSNRLVPTSGKSHSNSTLHNDFVRRMQSETN